MKKGTKILFSIVFFCALVSQISAQSVLKNGTIPKDLVITLSLSSSSQFAYIYDYKITSDGRVFFEDHSRLLPSLNFSNLTLLNINGKKLKKPKIPKLKDRISQKQIKRIILEFEKSGFFEMNEYYQGDLTLKEGVCVNHANIKGLSISANGKTKNVAFFLGCSYGENSPLKSFLNLYDKIDKELSGVKKTKLMK